MTHPTIADKDSSVVQLNHERVAKAMELLRRALGPFVERQIMITHPHVPPIDAARNYLDIVNRMAARPIQEWDVHGLLLLMLHGWIEIFKRTMGYAERNYVSELLEARNRWAHQDAFSTDDAYRVLDTTHRLLIAIAAPEAEMAKSLKSELLRLPSTEAEAPMPPGTVSIPMPVDPWDDLAKRLKVGDIVEGRVVSIESYGAFVEIESGFTGLVHKSEMSWTGHVRHASEKVSLGEIVKVSVLRLDYERRRLSLGMKQLEPNPLEGFVERYTPGTILKGIVRNIANFGVFVEIEPGINGLVHKSELSWTKKVQLPGDLVHDHQEMTVMILTVDKKQLRICLSHKQTQANPWPGLATVYKEGSNHTAQVARIHGKGIVVELPNDVEAFVPRAELRYPNEENAFVYREGDKLNLRVIRIEPDKELILMSETAREGRDYGDKEQKPVLPMASAAQRPKPAERILGRCPQTDKPVFLKRGRYGFYVQLGEARAGEKPRRTFIHTRVVAPEGVTLEIALQLLALPRVLGRHPETGQSISVGVGRYGPYVHMGGVFATLGRDDDLFSVTLDRAMELLDTKKPRGLVGKHPGTGKEIWVAEGRYGPYVRMDGIFASLGRDEDQSTITLERAVELIDAKASWR